MITMGRAITLTAIALAWIELRHLIDKLAPWVIVVDERAMPSPGELAASEPPSEPEDRG
jgi:hypothetical protein